jgi:hypothetical protein
VRKPHFRAFDISGRLTRRSRQLAVFRVDARDPVSGLGIFVLAAEGSQQQCCERGSNGQTAALLSGLLRVRRSDQSADGIDAVLGFAGTNFSGNRAAAYN